VQRLLAAITGKHALMAKLFYGGGLRLMECIRLRVQDVDFGQGLIFIRGGKGGKDRTTTLAKNVQEKMQKQVQAVKALHYKVKWTYLSRQFFIKIKFRPLRQDAKNVIMHAETKLNG
jgi:integrase